MRIKSFLLIASTALILSACAPKSGEKMLTDTKQDAKAYVKAPKKAVLISKARQTNYRKDYLKHYYQPWSKTIKQDRQEIFMHVYNEFKEFFENPFYGENKKRVSVTEFNSIKENLHLGAFTVKAQRAITVNPADIRRLPTDHPFFKNFKKPGDGYPFDMIQDSRLAANTPILEVARSRDLQWSLVKSHFIIGWIKASNLAYVDDQFVKKWVSKQYVVPLERSVSLTHAQSLAQSTARFGNILPAIDHDRTTWRLLTANRDQNNQAIIVPVNTPKAQFTQWPMKPTVANFEKMVNTLLGEPYGWGGMYGYRDCSSSMQDLFASFGVWLPRSSSGQAKTGRFVKLDGLSSGQKLARIKKSAKPMMTLMDIHGHVMLYLGMKNDTAYVFQNVWGVHNRRIGRSDGRIIIGKNVITPINLGEKYLDVKGRTPLDRVYGMSILSSGRV